MGREFKNYKGGLRPSFRFLSDKAVIIQAWKKAHEYMRRHNWYSDNFELDCSCIDLEELLLDIQSCFADSANVRYNPDPSRVVPAPKTCSGWNLGSEEFKAPENFSLRPLAHLTVRDQVVAMMFLMCLANTIERRQGPPRPYKLANVSEIAVNYGNRLLCEPPDDEADVTAPQEKKRYGAFLWGNSETYDRYYNDYRMFILRPEAVHKSLIDRGVHHEYELYTLSLDLSKFYDRIKREILFEKVKKEVDAQSQDALDFLRAFRLMLKWHWDAHDEDFLLAYQNQQLGGYNRRWIEGADGIPQGLAASGFFANIYMLDFDDRMREFVVGNRALDANISGIKVFDYCRYVDDMRLVVGMRKTAPQLKADDLMDAFQRCLDETSPGQCFSPEKVRLEKLSRDDHTDFVTLRMHESKSRTSDALDEQSAHELLKLNQDLWHEAEGMETETDRKTKSIGSIPLTRNRSGIKSDTIERFAANNWRNAYKVLSSILPAEEALPSFDEIKRECSLSVLDALTNEFCEEIILRWMDDPSKVRILRISFDLRPNAQYLEEVLKMLLRMISKGGIGRRCGFYVASELYRAGAIETGFGYSDEDSPYHKQWLEYRAKLHEYVARFATANAPWYLANQLALYEFTYLPKDCLVNCVLPLNCDQIYRECHAALSMEMGANRAEVSIEAVILASNISNPAKICGGCRDVIERAKQGAALEWRKCVAFLDAEVLSCFLDDSAKNRGMLEVGKLDPGIQYSLRDLAFMDDNPFGNEVSVARLGQALCEFMQGCKVDRNNFFTLSGLAVTCSDWKELSNPRNSSVKMKVSASLRTEDSDSFRYLFRPEPWEDKDFAKLAQIGRLLRAVVMAGDEYSAMKRGSLSINGTRHSGGAGRFSGVRSSWLKRRYGLYFDRACLGGVHVAFSPWFTEVLSSILAWPGSYCSKKYEKLRFAELKDIFRDRLHDLSRFQFVDPDTVLIPVDIDVERFKKGAKTPLNKINIAIIQSLHPDLSTLAQPDVRESMEAKRISRRHLSDLISMLRVTFRTHSVLMKKRDSINLLVFPELSIYERDIGSLRRFADTMNCMIFAGLVYCRDPRNSEKLINAGLWIIPQRKDGNERRMFVELLQGKGNLAHAEVGMEGLSRYRPVQWIVRGVRYGKNRKRTVRLWTMSASICYDATDVRLAAALRDHVDCYIVSAFNKDVGLFDVMAESWRYHMYGHTVVANTGIYGGSTIQAPYAKPYERIIAHAHGGNQSQILLAELDINDFSNKSGTPATKEHKKKKCTNDVREVKTSPAGYQGRIR